MLSVFGLVIVYSLLIPSLVHPLVKHKSYAVTKKQGKFGIIVCNEERTISSLMTKHSRISSNKLRIIFLKFDSAFDLSQYFLAQ